MEIPNYDSDGDGAKKFKQLFSYMPVDTFRMLICGNSGSGKTNLPVSYTHLTLPTSDLV